MLLSGAAHAQPVWPGNDLLGAEAVYQGQEASDAFSAIHYLGNGRIIAGKRSSQAANRFLLSEDFGETWKIVGCPYSTGAHTYFFGQNGATVLSRTGDTGSACLMKSTDGGSTWAVALSASQLCDLVGSANAQAVFSPVYLGDDRWIVNIKSFDTVNKVIMSSDNAATWYVPTAQPGQNASAWARQMILTYDNVLLWPSCATDRMYMSSDRGASWTSVMVPGAFLFQPLCDAGNGVYFCGGASLKPFEPISLYRSLDGGISWTDVTTVNLQRPTSTYWRDVIRVGRSLLASACCVEGTSNERHMQLFLSVDDGTTWLSLGNPYYGPYGGMQAIYQMCATESDVVFAGCQPDSTILRWSMPIDMCPTPATYCVASTTSIPGCQAALAGTGSPSASKPAGFTISSGNVPGGNLGICFFGNHGRASIPFGSLGGQICVQGPVFRSTPRLSGGTKGNCDGVFNFTLQDLIDQSPIVLAGSILNAELWARDPTNADKYLLSNGLEFTVCP